MVLVYVYSIGICFSTSGDFGGGIKPAPTELGV